jgi:hypothetical protein
MTLRRGFKSEANWLARDVRKDLGIAPHLPLCAWELADRLGFPVIPLSEFAASEPGAVAYLQSVAGQKDFSASRSFRTPNVLSFTTIAMVRSGRPQTLHMNWRTGSCCTHLNLCSIRKGRAITTKLSRRKQIGLVRRCWFLRKPHCTSPVAGFRFPRHRTFTGAARS